MRGWQGALWQSVCWGGGHALAPQRPALAHRTKTPHTRTAPRICRLEALLAEAQSMYDGASAPTESSRILKDMGTVRTPALAPHAGAPPFPAFAHCSMPLTPPPHTHPCAAPLHPLLTRLLTQPLAW